MESQEYEVMYQVEDAHWWYLGMASITRAVLNRWYAPGDRLRILDAGCGTGAAMTTYLASYGRVTGIDLSAQALRYCRSRKAPSIARASVSRVPFKTLSFDLVTSFDVLYERAVPDDFPALQEFARVLVQGGRLLLRLPAYNWLRGRHDQAVHTARRYTTGRVARLLEQSGLAVEHVSYANTLLFPVAVLKRLAERIRPARGAARSDLQAGAGLFNSLLKAVLALEAGPAAGPGLPYGLSVIAVGRKP